MARSPILEGPPKVRIPRRSERQRVDSLMYLDLGSENGGFPLNLTEDGMAFQGIRPLRLDQEIIVTFKLEGIEEPVTAMAKVVWLSETRKAGAVEFIDLPDATRKLIRDWITSQKEAHQSSQKTVVPKKMSQIEGVEWPPSKSKIRPAPIQIESPTQAAEIVAPVQPVSPPAAAQSQQVAAPSIAPLVPPDPEKLLPAPVSQEVPAPEQLSKNPFTLMSVEPKRRWTNSYTIGIAAGIAIMIAGGLTMRSFRGTLIHKAANNAPVSA